MLKEFQSLKSAIQTALVLHPFQEDKEIVIMTDASIDGVGAVPFNRVKSRLLTVACTSATLSDAERHSCQYECETLGIILALKRFHKCIYGKSCTVYTDSIPDKILFRDKTIPNFASPRSQRWCLLVASYNLDIQYTKEVRVVDFLSRLPLTGQTDDSEE